jgi:hypothetical protein
MVVSLLALGPPSIFHPVTDHGSERANRQVLMAVESEDGRAVGRVTHDGVGHNRHRVTLTQGQESLQSR